MPERQSFPEKEEEILAWWEENDTFKESVRRSEGKPPWSFYDGPPFATGLPHYGHILAGTIKVRRRNHGGLCAHTPAALCCCPNGVPVAIRRPVLGVVDLPKSQSIRADTKPT